MNFIQRLKEEGFLVSPRLFETPLVPQRVVLPLSQHTGKPSREIVSPGDRIKEGGKIAQADGFVSSNLHASISGEVTAIKKYFDMEAKTNAYKDMW